MNQENEFTNGYVESEEKVVLIPDDRKIIIRNMECRSEEVYSYLESGLNIADPIDAIVRALECGATVLKRAIFKDQFDYLDNLAMESFNTLEVCIKEFIDKNLDPSEQGTLARRISDTLQNQQTQIKELLTKGELNASEIEKKMATFTQSLQTSIQLSVGSALSSDQTGIAHLLRDVKTEIQSLRDALVSKAQKALSSVTVQGQLYEDEIMAILNKVAEGSQGLGVNVMVEDVRSISGNLGKQGDFIIRLLPIGDSTNKIIEYRICIEAKTQQQLSSAKILEICREAAENRGADFVVFASSDQSNLPAEFGSWTQFQDKIITSTVGLPIALKLVISKLLLEKAESQKEDLDINRAIELVQECESHLKKFGVLMSTARQLIKGSNRIQETAGQIRDGTSKVLAELFGLLSSNDKSKEDQNGSK